MKRRTVIGVATLIPAVAGEMLEQEKAKLRPPDVRYEPSSDAISRAILKLAKVTGKDVVYDLGCGDGRIVIMAVNEFGARGVGIDIDPERIKESKENAKRAGTGPRAEFRNEDLFETDISRATVVTLYLWPWVNLKLMPKLLRELRPGTRVVSHSHDMGEWRPERTIRVEGDEIHLWTIPARAENRE